MYQPVLDPSGPCTVSIPILAPYFSFLFLQNKNKLIQKVYTVMPPYLLIQYPLIQHLWFTAAPQKI
jgi:hypothetical protein